MRTLDYALIALWLYALATLAGEGGVLPDVRPVDSPFPGGGEPWLLLAAEANELSGLLTVGNSRSLVAAVPKNRRVLDYTETDEPAPWADALAWAKAKGSGQPYFVYRDGPRAAEGALSGPLSAQLAAVEAAMGVEP